jgi:hypothetical protein
MLCLREGFERRSYIANFEREVWVGTQTARLIELVFRPMSGQIL